MLQRIFSIYDSKTMAYMQPFFSVSKGAAIRALTDLLQDETHPISKHPEDYTLFELGEFNDNDATFNMESTPVSLGVAIEWKKDLNL